MIRINNVLFLDGSLRTLSFSSSEECVIEGDGLLALPSVIDPHVHFRVPGGETKEDWKTGAFAAIAGGVTHVLDMPNNHPSIITAERLKKKKEIIETQLKSIGIPLRYGLYMGTSQDTLEELEKAAPLACGIKIFMGNSTGDLVMEDREALEIAFQKGALYDHVVAIHAEEESILSQNQKFFHGITNPAVHSKIRSREAAISAVKKAIHLAEQYKTRLYLLHLSTKEEIELLRQAKARGLPIFGEVCTHHLFLDESDYENLGTFAQMNPPLRTKEDREALWNGIHDGTIDTIGTDHAPHLIQDKKKPYPFSPSGVPGIETALPLLLNATHEKKLNLPQLIFLMRKNIENLFRLPPNNDLVLVDMNLEKTVMNEHLKTKCGWSPFAGKRLKGWPVFTILENKLFFAAGAADYIHSTSRIGLWRNSNPIL